MRIVVSANGADLEAPASPVFGRCPMYVFVDTDTMAFEALENPAINAAGGAGIQAAQFVVEHKAQAVITGNVGPNAHNVLSAAGVGVYPFGGGTVRQAVEAFKAGELQAVGGATGPQHAGMGGGMGRGQGRGRSAAQAAPQASPTAREEEIAELQKTAAELRRRLAEVIERLDHLEKER